MGDKNKKDTLVNTYREDYLEIIQEMGKSIVLRKDEQIRTKNLLYLEKGVCALCVEGESGRDLSIIYFSPGRLLSFLPSIHEFYPHQTFSNCEPIYNCDFFIKAISDCSLISIDKDLFLEKFFHSLPLQTLIIQALVDNSFDLIAHIFNSLERPAWQRVAKLLYENMGNDPARKLKRKITYQEIATHLSIHPVTVAKIFSSLQTAGIISRRQSEITVTDPEGLLRIAMGKSQLFYKTGKNKKL